MNGRYGVANTDGRKDMRQGDWQNDSSKPKLAVAVDREPPHLQVLEELPAGTKFSLAANSTEYKEEIIFSMKHGLAFKPKFLCYFYCRNAPAGFATAIGTYQQNHGVMVTNQISFGGEGVFAEVDEEYFYIKHYVETYGVGTGTSDFYGSDFIFRVRFELINRKALFDGGVS